MVINIEMKSKRIKALNTIAAIVLIFGLLYMAKLVGDYMTKKPKKKRKI